MHVLDRPVWASLSSRHLEFSEGNQLARRYISDINQFASARDDSDEALAALAALIGPGESAFLLQVPGIVLPDRLSISLTAPGVQMIATRTMDPAEAGADTVALTEADAPEMLELARLTEPGPFFARTHVMGRFRGIRIDGRLAAMAGERMRLPGYTEVSGVCTHPDFRGHGLARRLSAAVAARIEARGETPFLHAWKSNTAAISLYEKLGFRLRSEVHVAVITHEAD